MTSKTFSIVQPSASGKFPDRIIMVEDDQTLRESIAEYLTCVGFCVTAVDSGLHFYHALASQSFAVAIIDLGLPDLDGMRLVEYIHSNTAMGCIILTARDSVEDRVSGYDSGADLYMVKPADCRELASALSRMLQRTSAAGQIMPLSSGQWRINCQSAILVTPSGAIITLTAREMDFLICLAASPEETIARNKILSEMGYSDDEFSNRALESLIRRLRRKIENVFGSSPILTRHRVGYSFSAPIVIN